VRGGRCFAETPYVSFSSTIAATFLMHSPTGALFRYDLWNIHGELNKFALPTEVRKIMLRIVTSTRWVNVVVRVLSMEPLLVCACIFNVE